MSEAGHERALAHRALDLLLYAPAGYVLRAMEDFPAMAAKGRDHLELQIRNARVVGEFVVRQGQRDLQRRLTSRPAPGPHRPPAATRPAPAPEPAAGTNGSAPAARPSAVRPSAVRPSAAAPGPPEPATASGPATASAPAAVARRPAGATGARPGVSGRDSATATAVDSAIEGYDTLSASQVVRRLDSLGPDELRAVLQHEAATRSRRTILNRAQQLLGAGEAPAP